MKRLYKGIKVAFVFLILLSAVVVSWFACRPYTDSMQLGRGDVIPLEHEWRVSASADSRTATLRWTLPESMPSDMALCLRSNYMAVTVWVGDEKLYAYGDRPTSSFGVPLGQLYLIVDLPASAQGQELRAEISSRWAIQPEQLTGRTYYGTRGNIRSLVFDSNTGAFIFGFLSLIFGALFLLLSACLALKRNKAYTPYNGFLYLGLFIFLAGLWVVTDSNLPQFITAHVEPVFYTSFFSFMLMPVALLFFIRETKMHGNRVVEACILLLLVNMAVSSCLHLAGLVPLMDSVLATHALLFICVVVLLVVCIREEWVYHNHTLREIWIGLAALGASALLAIVQFYVSPMSDNSFFFRIGLLVFIILLCVSAFKRAVAALNENAQTAVYKQLAYVDLMTHLQNRTAFEKVQADLEASTTQAERLGYIVFDINNLKETNDTYGHAEGDQLIIRAGRYIGRQWEGVGKCFRIGGDEFAVQLNHTSAREIEESLRSFAAAVADGEKEHPVKLNIAWGYAVQTTPLLTAEELLKKADADMYRAKIVQKADRQ